MIISLEKEYDTTKKGGRAQLLKVLKNLAKDDSKLVDMRKQIERAKLLTSADLELYTHYCAKELPRIKPFKTEFTQYSEECLVDRHYTFIKGTFYILPSCDNKDDIVYALIDKLVYEAMRHEFNEEPCLSLNAAISKFMPKSIKYKLSDFSSILAQKETASATYYGECLSDDSDSDEEEQYKALSKEKKSSKRSKAKKYRKAAHSNTFFTAFKAQSNVKDTHVTDRPRIERPKHFDRRQAEHDLKKINARLEQGIVVDNNFLASLDTQFLIAQYRGIHYVTSRWDAAARREHRELDELGKPQYSSAVFELEGVSGYHDMLNKKRDDPNFDAKLTQAALVVEDLLLKMQQSAPCTFEGYAYSNLFLALQKQYSANYDGFPDWIARELKKKNSVLAEFIKTPQRPLFSTSDVPNHALKYAFGVKLYEGHKDERLRPRWRADLRAERPYSGKVYLSLHPLTDYEQHKPSHLTSLFKQGLVNLPNVIVAERETSFLGYMPADRVVYHFKAKYPSFAGPYKKIMLYKYGINDAMYAKLQQAFKDWAPHTTERKNVIKSLGDYLAAYNEVRLVAKAERLARKQNKVLIYRDENGAYSLYLPDTPSTANKRLSPLIHMEREIYKVIAQEKGRQLSVMAREQFNTEEEKLRFIQHHCSKLLKNGYSLSELSAIEFNKLKLFNKTLQQFIVEDNDNLSLLLEFSLKKLKLCSDDNLLDLLEDEYITIEELVTWQSNDLANLLSFDNLSKPLADGYSLKDLSTLLKKDVWHLRCLTAESIEDLIIEHGADIPDLVFEYMEQEDDDFEYIMRSFSKSE